jgi:hypothetical protein
LLRNDMAAITPFRCIIKGNYFKLIYPIVTKSTRKYSCYKIIKHNLSHIGMRYDIVISS